MPPTKLCYRWSRLPIWRDLPGEITVSLDDIAGRQDISLLSCRNMFEAAEG